MPAPGSLPNSLVSDRSRLLFPELWPRAVLAAAAIACAAVVAYHDTFSAPFIFDDLPGIVRNPTIRHLWPPGALLLPTQPGGTGLVGGGPIVNLSLALNYAIAGLDVRGYHAVNLLIHIAAGVLLFAVLRRTFLSPSLRGCFSPVAFLLALATSLLWTLHPLQTESVTCVMRRTELLAGLFFLLTLHAFLRSTDPAAPARRWSVIAVAACTLGMMTNAVMVTAPVLVFLFDGAFAAGTFREAWRRRRGLYFALAAISVSLFFLVSSGGEHADAVGPGLGLSAWEYLLTQTRAILLYTRLAFWPAPLVIDYGMGLDKSLAAEWWQASVVVAMLLCTIGLMLRKPAAGFLGAWFFVTLATGFGIGRIAAHPIAEHRVYLALAAPAVLVAAGLFALGGRRGLIAAFGLALLCGVLTLRRNADYRSALTIWSDTVAKAPTNPRAHYNLANALSAAGRATDAIAHYETALRFEPGYAAAHYNLGGALLQLGRADEAVTHYEAALRLEPGSTDTHVNLAAALIRLGRGADAVKHYEAAARGGLLAAEEQFRFGRALAEIGRLDDALARLKEAARLSPKHAETHVVMGMVLAAAGRAPEALQHFTNAVLFDPGDAGARAALGDALIESNRPAEALSHYETALRLQPDRAAPLLTSLGNALWRIGRAADAIRHYDEALRLNPDDTEARRNLAMVRATVQRRGLLKN
ncbi:MAG: tetratricopeptide repeat protein [Opitutus sp.]|nr:tetratricopeptide repeat protein [Opitutus sp.]